MQAVRALTARQRNVLDHFHDVWRTTGAPPTIRAVMEHFGFSSPHGAEGHLRALVKKGFLSHRPGETPAYRPRFAQDESRVPILGHAPAGYPSAQDENYQGTVVVPWRVGERAFAIIVVGNSMVEAQILPRDVAVVDPDQEARDGQIVVALIDGEHTVKRLKRKGARWELHPANPDFPVMHPQSPEDRLVGRVVALVRKV
jgi:repressor LexA